MNKQKETISIVIPALNEKKFLVECLNSLRDQDYDGEYEIIVADNGSTDETINIAKNYGVRLVYCREIKSVFYARNVGANAARGNIIIQADADTLYPKHFLKRLAEQFILHPEVVAISGRFEYKTEAPWWAFVEYSLRHNINKLTSVLFGRPLLISAATFAFRRSAFLEANGYDGINYSPDQYGIAKRLSRVGRVIYDENILVLTSSRSVYGKPLSTIIKEGAGHIIGYGIYLAEKWTTAVRNFSEKSFERRLTVKLLPAVIVFIALIGYGYFVPTSSVFGRVYSEAETKEKVVALTFDDGPNDPYTSQVLDILARYNIKATFFLIGKNVEIYPETAKRIVAEGHAIGNHSYNHNANHALTDYGSRDILLAQQAIYRITGIKPLLYRPPHGKKTPWELYSVKKDGLIEVTWDVSANELHTKSPAVLASKIIQETSYGDIILLHDGYGVFHDTTKADKSLTVEALPLIIEQLQSKGYRFLTVPQLLSKF